MRHASNADWSRKEAGTAGLPNSTARKGNRSNQTDTEPTESNWPVHGQSMSNAWPIHGQFMS
eukprot:658969-Lingulodinium_polyedra.AAC.1